MPRGGPRPGSGRPQMYEDRSRISTYVERATRDAVNAYVEWQKEARNERAFSASVLMEDLLRRWMAEHQEGYLDWAADNLDWILENSPLEYTRVCELLGREPEETPEESESEGAI